MSLPSPFDREVYCIAGLPFDALSLESASDVLLQSIAQKRKLFLSTPNLNWLRTSRNDPDFRTSAILSDISIADGMPVVLLSRLWMLPIVERASGSDLIDLLIKLSKLKFFFFGGNDGVAELATKKINGNMGERRVVGYFNPGFCAVEQMSVPSIISQINGCQPDFLVVSLGATKGQKWIMKNFSSIDAPVVSHLGAVVNFQAGTIKRAPKAVRKIGFEWLWRIYQEPILTRRYLLDGVFLAKELFLRTIPYVFLLAYLNKSADKGLSQTSIHEYEEHVEVKFKGYFGPEARADLAKALSEIVQRKKNVIVNLDETTYLDARFLGSLLMLNKKCVEEDLNMLVCSNDKLVKLLIYFCGADYLLNVARKD